MLTLFTSISGLVRMHDAIIVTLTLLQDYYYYKLYEWGVFVPTAVSFSSYCMQACTILCTLSLPQVLSGYVEYTYPNLGTYSDYEHLICFRECRMVQKIKHVHSWPIIEMIIIAFT